MNSTCPMLVAVSALYQLTAWLTYLLHLAGGNVVFSKVSPPSTPHSPTAMKLEPYGSRKRSLDSTVSDTDDFQIPDRTALRRRIA